MPFRHFTPALAAVLLASSASADIITTALNNTATAKGDTSTGIYNPIDIYTEPGGIGVAFLLPLTPIGLTRGGGGANTDFSKALSAFSTANAGWTFVSAGADLAQNSLVVNADQVAGGAHNKCYQNPAQDCVGTFGTATTSGFAVTYAGAAIANAHWLQTVTTNSPATGQTSPYIDNKAQNQPYYDVPYNASPTVFLDAPNRSPTVSQYWLASLYYASGPAAAGQVTVYNGMLWGWADIFVNTANFAAFRAAIDGDLTTVASLDGAFGTGVDLSGDLTQAEVTQLDQAFDAAAVPEPSTVGLLLIGLGSLLGFARMRRAS